MCTANDLQAPMYQPEMHEEYKEFVAEDVRLLKFLMKHGYSGGVISILDTRYDHSDDSNELANILQDFAVEWCDILGYLVVDPTLHDEVWPYRYLATAVSHMTVYSLSPHALLNIGYCKWNLKNTLRGRVFKSHGVMHQALDMFLKSRSKPKR